MTTETKKNQIKLNADGQAIGGAAAGDKERAALVISADEFLQKLPIVDTRLSLCVNNIASRGVCGAVKRRLYAFYSPGFAARIFCGGIGSVVPLRDIDSSVQEGGDYSVFLKGDGSFVKERYGFSDLMQIMRRLTAPDGCEWDKAQTHKSIAPNMIEEAYEAVDAIEAGDTAAMIEETGDVFLQAMFHGDIAARAGEYDIFDVADALCKKLVGRHTHVFGSDSAADDKAALGFWEKAKALEKGQKSLADSLGSIPSGFPSAMYCQKAVKKAVRAGAGLDAAAIAEAMAAAAREREAGKMLFCACALCTAFGTDAEVELRKYTRAFIENCKAKPPGTIL
ncbi:MAG: hypothetical protein LBP26_06475 [Clostridiales bacterium]|jgi:uncharacterized protein YabN with tetrapyrrole methylase and pyrophosphatase domain|nr:hypothetical protein [Clostridiales bacterium]